MYDYHELDDWIGYWEICLSKNIKHSKCPEETNAREYLLVTIVTEHKKTEDLKLFWFLQRLHNIRCLLGWSRGLPHSLRCMGRFTFKATHCCLEKSDCRTSQDELQERRLSLGPVLRWTYLASDGLYKLSMKLSSHRRRKISSSLLLVQLVKRFIYKRQTTNQVNEELRH